MSGGARAWLAARAPAVPQALRAAVERELAGAGAGGDPVSELADSGCRALRRAVASPGRSRETAMLLLAADALLTYACEAAADADDVAVALTGVLDGVAGAGR